LQEGRVGADALALEFEKFIVFGDFVPTYPCGRNGGVANGVAENLSGDGPDDAGCRQIPRHVFPDIAGRQFPKLRIVLGFRLEIKRLLDFVLPPIRLVNDSQMEPSR